MKERRRRQCVARDVIKAAMENVVVPVRAGGEGRRDGEAVNLAFVPWLSWRAALCRVMPCGHPTFIISFGQEGSYPSYVRRGGRHPSYGRRGGRHPSYGRRGGRHPARSTPQPQLWATTTAPSGPPHKQRYLKFGAAAAADSNGAATGASASAGSAGVLLETVRREVLSSGAFARLLKAFTTITMLGQSGEVRRFRPGEVT